MMRDAISPSQLLSITLRFLSTGNTLEDLKFKCIILMETGLAIINGLKNCRKVTKIILNIKKNSLYKYEQDYISWKFEKNWGTLKDSELFTSLGQSVDVVYT